MGVNRLELNHATVCAALQEYFDKRWTGRKQIVAGVRQKVLLVPRVFELALAEVQEPELGS